MMAETFACAVTAPLVDGAKVSPLFDDVVGCVRMFEVCSVELAAQQLCLLPLDRADSGGM